MNPFDYQRATDANRALQAISPDAKFLAGGTNLIDLMKNGVERPKKLIDINRVALAPSILYRMAAFASAPSPATARPRIILWFDKSIRS